MKPAKPLPDQASLLAVLKYDPETGALNRSATGRSALAKPFSNGYPIVCVFGQKYAAHRIIWKLLNGTDPQFIDHINGDRADNRATNLRNVTHQENHRNAKLPKSNTSGCSGVYFHANRWRARIKVNYRYVPLGAFHNFDEAVTARKDGERRFGFHENHGRKTNDR